MTDEYKNRSRKISVTDNIQIQKHGSSCCITIIDRATGLTADLTETTLETIIRNNNMIDKPTDFGENEKIIKALVRRYNEYTAQREKLLKEFDDMTEGNRSN